MYLFISSYLHFKNPEDVCVWATHGQHRAQYITTSSVTSSMAFTLLKEVKASLTATHN
jgi:hypothetical protein